MTDNISERLSEIRERVEAATEGPWKLWNGWGPLDRDGKHRVESIGKESVQVLRGATNQKELPADMVGKLEDLEFIASARSDVPWLLSLVEGVGEALADMHDYDYEQIMEQVLHATEFDEDLADTLGALRDAAQEGEQNNDR